MKRNPRYVFVHWRQLEGQLSRGGNCDMLQTTCNMAGKRFFYFPTIIVFLHLHRPWANISGEMQRVFAEINFVFSAAVSFRTARMSSRNNFLNHLEPSLYLSHSCSYFWKFIKFGRIFSYGISVFFLPLSIYLSLFLVTEIFVES